MQSPGKHVSGRHGMRLATLHARGYDSKPTSMQQRLAELGIAHVVRVDAAPADHAVVLLNHASVVGSVGSTALVQVIDRLVNLPDNLSKLRRAVADERHLLIYVTPDRHELSVPLSLGIPADAELRLPDDVDVVWVVPAYDPPRSGWRFDASGWSAVRFEHDG